MRRLFAVSVFVLSLCAVAQAQTTTRTLFVRVAVNKTHVVFSYAGDLWSVERSGGDAKRFTDHPGEENFPVFSPDGSQLAFSRLVGANWDVFVMPASGGEAKRVTFHPRTDLAVGWTPDGKRVLTVSSPTGSPALHTIAPGDMLPVELPLPTARYGSFSPDGGKIAFATADIGEWRYYRGGDNARVFLTDLKTGAGEKLPQTDDNCTFPMWIGDRLYFVSDRTGIHNLFVFDVRTKQIKQLTNFEQHGIRFAGYGSDAVVFVRAGRLHLCDTATNQVRELDVRVKADDSDLKTRTASALSALESASPAPDGSGVIFGARGDVLLLDTAKNEVRGLTQTSGVAERYPTISPDGRLVAYFSDESGEYELHVRPLAGDGPVKKITVEAKPSFYRELTWSPDSKRLAFTDKRLALWLADVESGTTARIDSSTYSFQEQWYPAWSPDGRWLTYSKHLKNRIRTVFLYGLDAKRAVQVTDGRIHCELPCFDANGKYLYFASSPNAPMTEFGWGVLNSIMNRPLVTRRLHAAILRDGAPSPLLPNGSPNPEAAAGEAVKEVRIDLDGLSRRVVDLPTPARDYAALLPGKPGVLFALVSEWPASPALGNNATQIMYLFDLAKSPKFDKFAENVGGYELSADKSKLLISRRRDWYLVSTAEPPKPEDGKLDLKKLEITVDQRAEMKQMHHEAWRIMRDWFYDSNYHGQNLAELEKHFAEYLPTITRRADFNALLNRMLGHVSVSHLFAQLGDLGTPQGPPVRIGLLGADYDIANGKYRFKKVYRAGTFDGLVGTVQSPLDAPGVSVKDGEYLFAVDGKPLDATQNVFAAFENKVNAPVKITVGPNPNGDGSRTLTVFPIANETNLRFVDWTENNRRRVEQASGGKLGYFYVGDYGPGTMDAFRGLAANLDRPGVIIDQRFNGGGITPDYLIEWLKRKPIYSYTFREGDDIAVPVNPVPPVKVLIVNEGNFSAAETFALMYKLGKVGPMVGRRTGGGGIGPYAFTPGLIDGGRIQLPNRAAYDPSGLSWGIENVGVKPDFEVEITPADISAGRDPQLEKAIQVALDELKRAVPYQPKKPKYPIHR